MNIIDINSHCLNRFVDPNKTDLYLDNANYYYLGINKYGNKTYLERLHKEDFTYKWRCWQCYEKTKNSTTLDLFPHWQEITNSEFHPYEKFKEYIPYPTLNEEEFKELYDYMLSLEKLLNVEQALYLGYSGWSLEAQKHCNIGDFKMVKKINNKLIPQIRKAVDKIFSKKCKAN